MLKKWKQRTQDSSATEIRGPCHALWTVFISNDGVSVSLPKFTRERSQTEIRYALSISCLLLQARSPPFSILLCAPGRSTCLECVKGPLSSDFQLGPADGEHCPGDWRRGGGWLGIFILLAPSLLGHEACLPPSNSRAQQRPFPLCVGPRSRCAFWTSVYFAHSSQYQTLPIYPICMSLLFSAGTWQAPETYHQIHQAMN